MLMLTLAVPWSSAFAAQDEEANPAKAAVGATPANPYHVTFEDGNNGDWKAGDGTVTLNVKDGALNVDNRGRTAIYDNQAPSVKNGYLSMKVRFESEPKQFGILFRYIDKNNYAGLIQDGQNNWLYYTMINGQEGYGGIATKPYNLAAGQTYHFEVTFDDGNAALKIDGNELFSGSIGALPVQNGKIGMRSWFANKSWNIEEVTYYGLDGGSEPNPDAEIIELTSSSGAVSAFVDNTFPRVDHYVLRAEGEDDVEVYAQEDPGYSLR
ncbi:LamG domain-containing protein [Paenibacillus sp. CECT 9249]|nr:LamG domain-containing protein [Paenibacillus sp. CECT 9249]